MASTRIEWNDKTPEEILKSEGVRAMLRRRAEAVAERAKANAPVETGAYRESIRVEDDTTDRAVARVVARAPHALLVEIETGNLARALGSEGG